MNSAHSDALVIFGVTGDLAFSLMSLLRPERFELPTFWFVGHLGIFRLFQINALDG